MTVDAIYTKRLKLWVLSIVAEATKRARAAQANENNKVYC